MMHMKKNNKPKYKNNGNAIIISREEWASMPRKERKKLILDFAEGNKGLKKLLEYTTANGILTYGSCAGHPEEQDDSPYITFVLDDTNEKMLSKMLSYEISENVRMRFSNTGEIETLSIYIIDTENTSEEFLKIKENFERQGKNDDKLFDKLQHLTRKTEQTINILIFGEKYRQKKDISQKGEFDLRGNPYLLGKMGSTYDSGILVTFENTDEIAEKMIELLENQPIIPKKEENKELKELARYSYENGFDIFAVRDKTGQIVYVIDDQSEEIFSRIFDSEMEEDVNLGISRNKGEARFGISNTQNFLRIKEKIETAKITGSRSELFDKLLYIVKNSGNSISVSIDGKRRREKTNESMAQFCMPATHCIKDKIKPERFVNDSVIVADEDNIDEIVDELVDATKKVVLESQISHYGEDSRLGNIKRFCSNVIDIGIGKINSVKQRIFDVNSKKENKIKGDLEK